MIDKKSSFFYEMFDLYVFNRLQIAFRTFFF